MEKGIQILKPSLLTLRKTAKFLKTKLVGVRTASYFDLILDKWLASFDCNDEVERDWFSGMFRFQSLDQVKERLLLGRPVSFFQLQQRLFIPFGKGKSENDVNVVELFLDRSFPGKKSVGFKYYKVTVTGQHSMKRESFDSISMYGVLLPSVQVQDTTFGGLWTITTDTRQCFCEEFSIGRVWYCDELFSGILPPKRLDESIVGRRIGMVCKYTENDKDGNVVGEGLQYYNGIVTSMSGRSRIKFTIVWDGKEVETSVEELNLQMYGLFEETGWILV